MLALPVALRGLKLINEHIGVSNPMEIIVNDEGISIRPQIKIAPPVLSDALETAAGIESRAYARAFVKLITNLPLEIQKYMHEPSRIPFLDISKQCGAQRAE